jgi:MarR family transcriptional regulator, lower aerobic nicotinate degradation pathway regulator
MVKTADLGIVDALAQLSFLVQGTLAKRAAEADLSMIQTRLLGVLRDRQPTMQELAAILDLDKSSITGLVDRAEARGYVRRIPSAEDRRAVHVRLTASGRRLVNRVAAAFAADLATVTSSLSLADRTRLSHLASQVVLNQVASPSTRERPTHTGAHDLNR